MLIRPRSLFRSTLAAALAVCALVAGLSPAAASTGVSRPLAGTGTVTGQVAPAPAGVWFEPVVRATRLDVVGPARSTVANAAGRYRLRLPVGLWAVSAPSWSGDALSYVTRVVPVGARKTTVLRARPAATLAVAPIRLSVAPFTADGTFPDGVTAAGVKAGYADMVIVDLVNAMEGVCSATRPEAAVVEYRGPGGRYADLLREIRLGQTRYANAEFRAMAKQAVRAHKANAPTHTVNGTITFANEGGQTIQTLSVRATENSSGAVTWQKEYSGPADADFFFSVTEELGKDLANEVCRKDAGTYPKVLRVSATATVTGSDDSVSGTVKATAEWDVTSRAGEPTNYEATAPIVWTIESSSVTSPGRCAVAVTGVEQPGASVAIGGAAIDDAKRVKLNVASVFQVGWRETQPPSSCTDSGALGLVLSASSLAVPLGGTGTSTGTSIPGTTFTITAKVTAR